MVFLRRRQLIFEGKIWKQLCQFLDKKFLESFFQRNSFLKKFSFIALLWFLPSYSGSWELNHCGFLKLNLKIFSFRNYMYWILLAECTLYIIYELFHSNKDFNYSYVPISKVKGLQTVWNLFQWILHKSSIATMGNNEIFNYLITI